MENALSGEKAPGVSRVHFFPVRHHSPTAARLVRGLIEARRPRFVLIEGPSDYNDQIRELARDHRLPIALYTYVVSPEGQRRGAFYPFCVYSPEWQALRAGFEVGATVRFIDLPWAELADDEAQVAHRYADHELKRSGYVARLCEQLGVQTFDDVWDELVEIDPAILLERYLERAGTLSEHLRAFDDVPPTDVRREAFMAGEVRRALREDEGEVVVVTGGYHTSALRARLADDAEAGPEPAPDEPGRGRGIALTPYSYAALDALTGYEAGLPNPGFYHRVWIDRANGRPDSHRGLLFEVAEHLRDAGQVASAADLVAVETTARALARLRGHVEVWRNDLVDGIIGALVKDELGDGASHPMLAECYRVFRGGARGRLAEGTTLPALVLELRHRLRAHELEPDDRPRSVSLDLYRDDDLAKSRLLHSCRVLEVVGFAQIGEAPVSAGVSPGIRERWRLQWHPEFEASAIQASTYGPSVREAVAARLLASTRDAERDAVAAAALLLDASLAGIDHLSGMLHRRVRDLLGADGDLAHVGHAMGSLLYLYRYDAVLRTVGRSDVGALLSLAYRRAAALLDGLTGGSSEHVQGLAAMLETYERCRDDLDLSHEDLLGLLERAARDPRKTEMLRGAALGALWTLGSVKTEALRADLRYFSEPAVLGDFLAGLFRTAREVIQRRPELAAAVDEIVVGLSAEAFLAALPGLRLAFARFTPREKGHIAQNVLEAAGEVGPGSQIGTLEVSAEVAARMAALEAELERQLTRFGIRGRRGSRGS